MPFVYRASKAYAPRRYTTRRVTRKRKSTVSSFGAKAKRGNRAGANYNSFLTIPRTMWGNNPFPPSRRGTLTYSEMVTLTTGSGVFGTQAQFRLNSLYDPNSTGAGHQPNGFDELSTAYSKYRVDACRWTLLFTTPGAANDIKCAVIVQPNATAGLTSGNLWVVNENPNGYYGALSSNGDRRCILTGVVDCAKLAGVSKTKYMAEGDYSAAINNNPSITQYLTTAIACYDGTTAVSCQVEITMEFDCVFYNREVIASS